MGLVLDFCTAVGLPGEEADRPRLMPGPCLPGRLPAGRLAVESVGCLGLAATLGSTTPVTVDSARVAASFRADQLMRVNGEAISGFAPGSGFFRTVDGWVRTHANYPRHREALLGVLSLPPGAGREEIAAALATHRAMNIERAVYEAGGIAVAVRSPREWREHPQSAAVAAQPLVAYRQVSDPSRPRRATLRVLDLTRVIAGPVATRALAWLGHEVLRLDPPWLPEIEAQHLDTGAGKRTARLDVAADRAEVEHLLQAADVVVTGYRPGGAEGSSGLERAGLGAGELLAKHPHLIVASLSAWGVSGPWGGRRGFDSIVQAATGIGVIEGDADRPGALAAQALDHATGYLLAAAVLRAAAEGGGHEIRLSLARTAHWLLDASAAGDSAAPDSDARDSGAPDSGASDSRAPDVERCLVDRDTYAGVVRGPRPALDLPGVAPADYPYPPRPFGADPPRWWPGQS